MSWPAIVFWTVFVVVNLFIGAAVFVCYMLIPRGDTAESETEYPITGDPTFTRTTGDYQTGVVFRLPEPADQAPDDGGPVPKLDENWPGLRKPKRRAF